VIMKDPEPIAIRPRVRWNDPWSNRMLKYYKKWV
jgi:hypothetical protein